MQNSTFCVGCFKLFLSEEYQKDEISEALSKYFFFLAGNFF